MIILVIDHFVIVSNHSAVRQAESHTSLDTLETVDYPIANCEVQITPCEDIDSDTRIFRAADTLSRNSTIRSNKVEMYQFSLSVEEESDEEDEASECNGIKDVMSKV